MPITASAAITTASRPASGSIRCSQARSGRLTGLPSGPTIFLIGVGGQYLPPLASVAYDEASSSGLVAFGPRVNEAFLPSM